MIHSIRHQQSLLTAVILMLIPWQAQADQVKKISGAYGDSLAFVGVNMKGLQAKNDPYSYTTVIELDRYRREHKNATAAELKNYYRVLQYDRPIEKVTWFENALKGLVGAAEKVPGPIGRGAKTANWLDNLLDKADQIEQGRHQKGEAALEAKARQALLDMQLEARQKSRPGNPIPLAEVLNDISTANTGKDIPYNSTVEAIANKDPEYAQNPEMIYMQGHRELDRSIRVSFDEVTGQIRQLQDNVNDQMTEMRGVLGEIAAQQQDIIKWQLSQIEQQQRAAQSQRFQEKLQQADEAVSGYSALLKFINPQLGQKVEVAGKASIQFAKGINGLIDAVSKGGDGLFSLASAAATGNMIGAVMQVFSLFGSSGPSADQLILEGIQDLKEQIEGLRQEMHERFDRIDKKLNEIMDEMSARFNRIDFQLGVLNDNVTDIQIALVGLQADLNRIEKNLFSFLDDGFRQDLRLAINGWLGYHERTGIDMTYADYSNAATGPENQFFTWATTLSRDQLRAGPNSRDYSDSGLLAELTNYPLHFNINYLAQFPAQRFGLPSLASGRLPNPRDWSSSADAYRTLTEENRKYDQLINPARLDAIYSTGTALQSALKNITVLGSSANYPLFNALQTNYNSKLTGVQQAIQSIDDTYYKNPTYKLMLDDNPNNFPANRALDIFGRADQAANYTPNITSISYSAGSGQSLSQGAIQSRFYIPEPFILADYMTWKQMPDANIGRISLSVVGVNLIDRYQNDANWRPYTEISGDPNLGTGANQYRYFKDEIRYVRPKISIGLMWQGTSIRVRSIISSEIEAHRHRYYTNNNSISTPQYDRRLSTEAIEADTPAWVRANWDSSLKPMLESSSTEESPTDTELLLRNSVQLQIGARVEGVLRNHQIALYNNILSALDSATTLRSNARILTGAKELWIAYIAMGMSRTLENDEQLRGLLFGEQSLVDTRDTPGDSILHGVYQDAVNLLQAGQNVPKVDIQSIGQARSNTLQTLLTGILDKIAAHTYSESLELVEVTLLQLELFRKTRYNPTIADITSVIKITRQPARFNRAANTYSQQLILKNEGSQAFAGPVSLVVDRVGNDPIPIVTASDGQTLFFSLNTGNHSPYLNVGVGADNLFSPGETVTITVEITVDASATAKPPRYRNRILAGEGER